MLQKQIFYLTVIYLYNMFQLICYGIRDFKRREVKTRIIDIIKFRNIFKKGI